MYPVLKVLITALVVVGVSELAKRYSLFAAAIASLPLTSILAFIWLYKDTGDTSKVAQLSTDIFWMVLPSLAFFVAFPLCVKWGLKFTAALVASCLFMAAFYAAFMWGKQRIGY